MRTWRRMYRWLLLVCLAAACVSFGYLWYEKVRDEIPDEMQIFSGERVDWGEMISVPFVQLDSAVEVSEKGSYQLQCRFLGVIPLKMVKISTIPRETVYASGSPVGIYMETKGVLVIGCQESSPAQQVLKAGDYICSVDGKSLESKKELIEAVKAHGGRPMELGILREQNPMTVTVVPKQTGDGTCRIGAWVRDNIQGIGTLTLIQGDGSFAALGHGISDLDTGQRLSIASGELYQARILAIRKGIPGNPGELQGVIDYQEVKKIGRIDGNTDHGIAGRLQDSAIGKLNRYPCEIGLKQELREGGAEILCNIGDGIRTYEIEILEISRNAADSNKSFVIEVRDPELLKKTGGIVQGMSGSPILQKGKLVGAVTHVFVNDPRRGYGIFIENMMQK